MMDNEQFSQGRTFLARKGINLVAVFSLKDLPNSLLSCVKESEIEIKDYQRLVLLGHSGRQLWNALKDEGKCLFASKAPIDRFSRQIVEQAVRSYWNDSSFELLYPGDNLVPLQQLGKMAGWHHDSPMGVGINEDHGLWFAYRALFLIDAALPLNRQSPGASPCENCLESNCITACPAAALSRSESIDVGRCTQFRLEKSSPCRDRCLSRERCPVAPQRRYDREQIGYHYLQSLAVIQEYYS